MNRFKRFLCYNFPNNKKIRKYIGGYWEQWEVEHFGLLWLNVSEENAFKKNYRPGLGKGSPYCEYYSLGFFGQKSDLSDKLLTKLDRRRKLKRVRNENKKRIRE